VTGHSLGAGTAAVLAALLQCDYSDVICFAFSPPGWLVRFVSRIYVILHRVPKKVPLFLHLTLSNAGQFSKFFCHEIYRYDYVWNSFLVKLLIKLLILIELFVLKKINC